LENTIILHRINKINELKKIDTKYGVEVDVRSFKDKLICSHDPFLKGDSFDDWIKEFNHKFLIINIKEEGIEKKLIEIMKFYKIKNFFLLDVTFPFIFKLSKKDFKNLAYRISDLENFNENIFTKLKINWVWLDTFYEFSDDLINKINRLKQKHKLKLCLCSPELHMSRNIKISNKILEKIYSSKLKFDAICTKNPKLWF
jgi:hypothetical protein